MSSFLSTTGTDDLYDPLDVDLGEDYDSDMSSSGGSQSSPSLGGGGGGSSTTPPSVPQRVGLTVPDERALAQHASGGDSDDDTSMGGLMPPGSPITNGISSHGAAVIPISAPTQPTTERILEFLSDKAKKKELCQGRTEYGHMCLQPAEENGFCRYHHSQLQNSALVSWDERLFIVLDLDQTLVYTPTDGEEFPANVRLNIQDIIADGTPMKTAIRPFALEMLEQLDSMFTVFVVTGGTPSYCKAIVDLLNRLAAGKEGNSVIKLGVSCRSTMIPVQAQPKTFHLVLPNPQDHRFALAIDNCFPDDCTRVLTDRGFMFLDEIAAVDKVRSASSIAWVQCSAKTVDIHVTDFGGKSVRGMSLSVRIDGGVAALAGALCEPRDELRGESVVGFLDSAVWGVDAKSSAASTLARLCVDVLHVHAPKPWRTVTVSSAVGSSARQCAEAFFADFAAADEISRLRASISEVREVRYAAFCEKTRSLEYRGGELVLPNGGVPRDYELVDFSNSSCNVSLQTTRNHTMFASTSNGGSNSRRVAAEDLLGVSPADIRFTAVADSGVVVRADDASELTGVLCGGFGLRTRLQMAAFMELYFHCVFRGSSSQKSAWVRSLLALVGTSGVVQKTVAEHLSECAERGCLEDWVLRCCTSDLLAHGVVGARVACGAHEGATSVTVRSSVLRDQLCTVFQLIGFTAHFASCGSSWTVQFARSNGTPVVASVDRRLPRASRKILSERLAVGDDCVCKPTLRGGKVQTVVRRARIWCVEVDHPDHLIVAQRADRTLDGTVVSASRPIIVGNCRKAWARECRDQVVIVPDWAPHLLLDEQENLLKQVFERVLQVHERLRKRAFHVGSNLAIPSVLHVADVLQALYEEEEKARMLRRALTERVDNVVKLMREKVYL